MTYRNANSGVKGEGIPLLFFLNLVSINGITRG